MRFTSLALVSAAAISARAADNPDDPTGKTLYITEPSCGYFECIVTWKKGSTVAVNWLGPPQGQVSVALFSQDGGPTYSVVNSIASISQEGYCDSGAGYGVVQPGVECGRIEFTVPGGWEERSNYTIAVQSLSDPSLIGYTDDITVASAAQANADNVPSGTQINLLTIPGPTSTNYNGARDYPGKLPAPTAVTGASRSSSQSSSAEPTSSASSSSSRRSSSSASSPSISSTAEVTSPATSSALSLTSVASVGSLAAASSVTPSSTAAPSSGAPRIAGQLGTTGALLALVFVGMQLL